MNIKRYIAMLLVAGTAVAGVILFWSSKEGAPGASQPSGLTNAALQKLHSLLVDDYHSTDSQTAITSALAHELIAEQLRTNQAFLEWATNAVTAAITRFITNGNVSVYGAAGLTADRLQFYKLTTFSPVGLEAEAIYDPNPRNEGPLIFVVDGGIHPTISLIKNPYRIESYQLDPGEWKRFERHIGPMNWSSAVTPLDKRQVDELARKAFHAMTGTNLDSFKVLAKIETDGLPSQTDSDGKILSAKDVVYPFATFEYGNSDLTRVTFEGEIVQTSPGHGEFVSLFALLNKTEAIFELGEKFLGRGTWEQGMLDQVNSMSTEQREQVYRRIFNR